MNISFDCNYILLLTRVRVIMKSLAIDINSKYSQNVVDYLVRSHKNDSEMFRFKRKFNKVFGFGHNCNPGVTKHV